MSPASVQARGPERPVGAAIRAELVEQLDWIESTGAAHRAAVARLTAARNEPERREAAREEALAGEIHRVAVNRLHFDHLA